MSDCTGLPRQIKDCMERAGAPLTEDQYMLLAGYLAQTQSELTAAKADSVQAIANNHERLVEALEDCCEALEYEHAQSEEARQARALLVELDAGEGGEV